MQILQRPRRGRFHQGPAQAQRETCVVAYVVDGDTFNWLPSPSASVSSRGLPSAARWKRATANPAAGCPVSLLAGAGALFTVAAGNVRAALRESRTALSTGSFVAEARRYVPDITARDVVRGPRGIRAQAMDAKGRLLDDFAITGSDRVVHVRNAPSPGATSALAIAEHIVGEALRRGGFGSPAERTTDL